MPLARLRQMLTLADLLSQQEQLATAEGMYLRALAGYEKALGPGYTLTLDTVNSLGVLYWKQDRLHEAEQMLLRALAERKKALGSDRSDTLTIFQAFSRVIPSWPT